MSRSLLRKRSARHTRQQSERSFCDASLSPPSVAHCDLLLCCVLLSLVLPLCLPMLPFFDPRRILLCSLLCSVVCFSLSSGTMPYPTAPTDASFCDRLASANGYDYTNANHSYALMLKWIQRAYNGADVNLNAYPPVVSFVQGLMRNTNTIKFFNGWINYRAAYPEGAAYPAPTPDYTTSPALALALDLKLAAYFGQAFGCSGIQQWPTVNLTFSEAYPYTGNQNQIVVHRGMAINGTVFSAFIDQFSDAALSLGAQQFDFDANVVPFLMSFARGAQGDYGICQDEATCPCATGYTGNACTTAIQSTGVSVTAGNDPTPARIPGAASASAQPALVIAGVLAIMALML